MRKDPNSHINYSVCSTFVLLVEDIVFLETNKQKFNFVLFRVIVLRIKGKNTNDTQLLNRAL